MIRLSLFWLALSLLWGAVLGILLQVRVQALSRPGQEAMTFSLVAVAGALTSSLVQLLVGTLSDRTCTRWGRRRPYLLIGSLLAVGPLIWLVRTGSLGGLLAAYCLLQLTVNLAAGPFQALIPDLVPRHRQGEASGYLSVFQLLGQAGGVGLAGLMVGGFVLGPLRMGPERGTLLLAIILAAVFNLLMAATLMGIKEAAGSPPIHWKRTLRDCFSLRLGRHLELTRLLAARFMINIGFYLATAFLIFFVGHSLGAADQAWATGKLMLVMTLGAVASALPAGLLSDRLGRKRVILGFGALGLASAVALVAATSYQVAIWEALGTGIGTGALIAVVWSFACGLVPAASSAQHMATWNLSSTIPQVVALSLGGPVATLAGGWLGAGVGYRVVMAMALCWVAAGLMMMATLREPARPA